MLEGAARIIRGPVAADDGAVHFDVELAGQVARITAGPLGIGVEADAPAELAALAVDEVERYLRAHEANRVEWYREAALLRRASGKPAPAGNTKSAAVQICRAPVAKESCLAFATHNGRTEVRVLIFKDGALIDDCDDWEAVTDADRDAAITTAIDWVVENEVQARELGLDPTLIRDIWR
jgi:hypothetical protein